MQIATSKLDKYMVSPLSPDRLDYSNTDPSSELSIVGACDTYVFTKCVTKSCDMPDWIIRSCINLP